MTAKAVLGQAQEPASKPWWKYGHVWLIISGPLVVVIAGFITAYIAFSGADVVVDRNYYQNGLDIDKRLNRSQKSIAPAQAVRNHAVTPEEDLPDLQPK